MKLKLSIITINLNDRKGLERTIHSVRAQSWKNFEHIIIDGGSKDGSVNTIRKYESGFSHWISEKDQGLYHAMNKGIKSASGEFCLFLNSGDVLSDADALLRANETRWEKDVIYFDMISEFPGGIRKRKHYLSELSWFYLGVEIINHQSQLIRTKVLKGAGGFDLKYRWAADFELFARLVFQKKKTYQHIPKVLSIYGMDGRSSGGRIAHEYAKERFAVIENLWPPDVQRHLRELRFFESSLIGLEEKDQVERSMVFAYFNRLGTKIAFAMASFWIVRKVIAFAVKMKTKMRRGQ